MNRKCRGLSVVVTDRLTQEQRSANMRAIRGRDTAPEFRVRQAAHAAALRFRLQRRDLPGTPDLVFPRHRVALFVHGCYWHRHADCRFATTPSTNAGFWTGKFAANVERDRRKAQELEEQGWRVAVIWECETRDPEALPALVRSRVLGFEYPPAGRNDVSSSAG